MTAFDGLMLFITGFVIWGVWEWWRTRRNDRCPNGRRHDWHMSHHQGVAVKKVDCLFLNQVTLRVFECCWCRVQRVVSVGYSDAPTRTYILPAYNISQAQYERREMFTGSYMEVVKGVVVSIGPATAFPALEVHAPDGPRV